MVTPPRLSFIIYLVIVQSVVDNFIIYSIIVQSVVDQFLKALIEVKEQEVCFTRQHGCHQIEQVEIENQVYQEQQTEQWTYHGECIGGNERKHKVAQDQRRNKHHDHTDQDTEQKIQL
uniref:Uncharacterized protein n=1 Tax=Cacopsylla melanoneura TaxID=428564 RepID=A0A8D8XDM4_9HEMI